MIPFLQHTGIAAPLKRSNVDTDQIIPVEFVSRQTTKIAEGLFATWREDPSFVLNIEPFSRATILVAGPDFGTGSSREHAVWALMDFGFRAVVSARFGDIFRGNASKRGLLAAQCEQAFVDELWNLLDRAPGTEVTVDLQEKRISAPGFSAAFVIDEYTRWRLLEGLDDIGLTLRHSADIGLYEQSRPRHLPTTRSLGAVR